MNLFKEEGLLLDSGHKRKGPAKIQTKQQIDYHTNQVKSANPSMPNLFQAEFFSLCYSSNFHMEGFSPVDNGLPTARFR